jgi:hypothetical protein
MAYDIPTDNVLNARDVDRETRISELMTFASFEISPVWANIYNTSQGVFGIGDFNKDYIISRNYELGQEGIIKPDTGKTSLYGGSQVDAGAFTRFNDSMIDTAVWPDPQLSPTTKSVRLDIGMSAFLTNYNSTMGEALADADPRTIANILSGKDQRFAETVTRNQAHYFWANQNDNYSYCRAENVGTVDADYATASGAQPVLVFQTSNDAPSRFSEGQLVDFLYYEDQSGGATFEASDIAHDGFMGVVVNVDRLENKVYVRFINTSTGALATVDTVAAGDGETAVGSEDVTIPEGVYVVPHGTRGLQSDGSTQASMGMLGPNAFYKASGTLLGDEAVSTGTINVDQISRMKSKIKAVGGALTQQTLTRSLNNFNDAYRDQGHMIDTMVTTQGVVNEYLNNQAARRIADVGGAPYTLSHEGFDGKFTFQNGDQKFDIVVDPYVEAGALYGFKFANQNWKRAAPADYGNFAGGIPDIPQAIPFKFVAQAGGYPTNAVPINDTQGNYNKFTGNVQMPGIVRCQHFPEHPAGFKLTGLTEDREFQS